MNVIHRRSTASLREPLLAVLVAMLVAFLLFLFLDALEQIAFSQAGLKELRLLHLLRGFLATAGGMSLVWLYMSKKERQIYALRDQLAGQLQVRTQQLSEVDRALREQREDFIDALKHNLYTPILAQRRAVGLLLDQEFGKITDRQREILEAMIENDDRFCVLVDRLVEIYRYQNGIKQISRREEKVLAIVDMLRHNFKTDLESGRLQVVNQTSQWQMVSCDIEQIVIMLGILVSNALRYARSQCSLIISVEDDHVYFKVEDDGGLLQPEVIPTLFSRLYSGCANGRRNPIVGTGLCLSYQIANAHGGGITCDISPGVSTSFTVELCH